MAYEDLRPLFAEIARNAAHFEHFQTKFVSQILASQKVFQQSIARMAAIDQFTRNFAREIDRIGEQIRSSWLTIQRGLIDPDALARVFQAWDAAQKHGAAILAEKGWWLTPDMSMHLLTTVVRLDGARKRRQINRLMCDYYNARRLRGLLTEWNEEPLFSERRHLFDHALWAHRQKRWYLSIPMLLTQIDGILQDFAQQKGLPKNTSVRKIAKQLRLESTDPKAVISDTWQAQLDAIFGSGYYQTEVRQPGLRRNAILHGLELRYGSEVRSTQLFLQLDTIHWLIKEQRKKAKTKSKTTARKARASTR